MLPMALGDAQAGDVLVFRLRPQAIAKHIAILSGGGPARMIHAQSNDQVREVTMTPSWSKRAVAAFAFPGISA
jgi:cell wall-associated NlpC family hydrolase